MITETRIMPQWTNLGLFNGPGNALLPAWHQTIIWINDDLLSTETNFTEIFIKILNIFLKKCIWKCHLQNAGHFVYVSIC